MKKVLVVEDNVTQAESLGLLLRMRGHRVFLAGDGAQGMAQVETHGCDAAVIDLLMPGTGGGAFLAWLRGRPDTASIPVVVSTALPPEDCGDLACLPGVTILQKPYSPEELFVALGV